MSSRPIESESPNWHDRRVVWFQGQHDSLLRLESKDDTKQAARERAQASGECYRTITLREVFHFAPAAKDKMEGPAFIPSTYDEFDAREHSAQREKGQFVALTGDIDKGDHERKAITSALAAFSPGTAALVYSSPNSRPGNRRWRIIIPLAEPQSFYAWHDAQLAFFAFMASRGIAMDPALARAAQPVFLPNVPQRHEKSDTDLRGADGKPLYYAAFRTKDALPGLDITQGEIAAGVAAIRAKRAEDEATRERIRREAEARRANAPRGDNASLIDDFNAANSVAAMLELCGYEQSPRHAEDWKSPQQTGETFATRIIGSKWVSLSQSDSDSGLGERFAEGCFGDAYDLYVHYKHGGDHKAAYRQLGAEKRAAQGNVTYPPQFHAEPPEWMDEVPPSDEAPEWYDGEPVDPEPEPAEDGPRDALPLIEIGDWIGKTPPDRQFAWGDNIPLMTTTMLTGPGGVGKSLFEQMLCTCIALGLPFLGAATRQMNTLYVTCEDEADELWRRQVAICAALKIPLKATVGKLHLVSLCGENETALATFDDKEQIERTPRWRQLVETCLQNEVRLFAFDNATDAMAGDLNSIHQVAEFVNLLTGLAIRINGAAMILHHPNKAGDDWLGSIAWHNKVRSRLIIKRSEVDGDEDGRVLENPKANYGPSGGKIDFRWHKGAFVADRELPEDYAAQLSKTIAASGANEAFMRCLRVREGQKGREVGPKIGPSYAPSRFAEMVEAKGYDKRSLAGAMERLIGIGAIVTEEVYNPKAKRWATVFREVR